MDIIKITGATLISAFVASIEPVHNAIFVLVFVFFADIFWGMLASILVKKERFGIKKFMNAAVYLSIYLLIVVAIFVIGYKMEDEAYALFAVKTITYVIIYFYSANILKNLTRLFPENKPIRFLEYVLHLEILKKVPALEDFLNQNKKEENES